MIYDDVKYIIDELSNIKKEKKLAKNLELISYYCDSNHPEKTIKCFRKLIERINTYTNSKNINYQLYIIKLILLFLLEIKNQTSTILSEKDIFKLITTIFLYIEKIIKNNTKSNKIYKERRKEIISIIYNNFREEFYYRKNRRFLSIQYKLPFN